MFHLSAWGGYSCLLCSLSFACCSISSSFKILYTCMSAYSPEANNSPARSFKAEAKPDGNAVTCYIACGTTYLYTFYVFGFDGPSA